MQLYQIHRGLKVLIDTFNQNVYLGYITKQKLALEITLKSIVFRVDFQSELVAYFQRWSATSPN